MDHVKTDCFQKLMADPKVYVRRRIISFVVVCVLCNFKQVLKKT